ncbi:6-phosphogluconolactonase [Myxococcaceae bacterium GXIMD 01537]
MARPAPRVVAPEALASEAAAWFAQALGAALAARPRCSFALSGGSTPGPVLRALATHPVDWSRVDFFFVDERCVPPDSPESNYRLARENLFERVGATPAQVFRMEGERPDADAAARDYETRLPEALDVVLLGLGEDGHVASLFPGSPALQEEERRVLAVVGPKPPPRRLTLTLPALLGAREVLGVVAGAGKREAVRQVLSGGGVPGALVTNAHWLLDRAAAGQ